MRVDKPEFKGDFLDIILGLHTGDSVSFFVRLDSLKKYYNEEFEFQGEYEKYDTMQYLGFAVKVDSIYSRDHVVKLRQEAAEAQRLQNLVIDSMRVAEPAAILKYIAENKIKEKPSSSGVYYIEKTKGKGANVKNGQLVKIRYTGKFVDGIVFDSNTGPNQPLLEFVVGEKTVISGMDDSMVLMKKGGKATLIIPSSQAYGDGGERMKPYATLIFDVELVEVWDQK